MALSPNPAMQTLIRVLNSVSQPGQESFATQESVDQLDEALLAIDHSSHLYGRGIARLRKLCRSSGILPSSCYLTDEIPKESLKLISQTGLSDIWSGRCGTQLVAVKSLRVHQDNKAQVEKSVMDEVIGWKYLHHPNIVPFLGISKLFPICIVSEWMVFGTLRSYLASNPAADRSIFVHDILQGLSFMHSQDIVHGDLKSDNILIDAAHRARIGDFGLVVLLLSTHTISATSSTRGTLRWMSPELLTEVDLPTTPSDMWAVAMVFYEIFSGNVPFYAVSDIRAMNEIMKGTTPERPTGFVANGLVDDVWSIMQDCWAFSPDLRPSCTAVLGRLSQDATLQAQEWPMPSSTNISGIFEIHSLTKEAVLDVNETTNKHVIWWQSHAGDNQRWLIKKAVGGHTLSSIMNGHFLAGSNRGLEDSDLWIREEPFLWDIAVVSNAYAIMLPHEGLAVTLQPYGEVNLEPYVASKTGQLWKLNREQEERRPEVAGSVQFIHVPLPKRSLELVSKDVKTGIRCGAKAHHMRPWELVKTARGYAIRSLANQCYLHVRGHKPVNEGMALRTGATPTSWWIELVGSPKDGIYRIRWPGSPFAIGYLPVDESKNPDYPPGKGNKKHWTSRLADLRMLPISDDGPHLHWKLTRFA